VAGAKKAVAGRQKKKAMGVIQAREGFGVEGATGRGRMVTVLFDPQMEGCRAIGAILHSCSKIKEGSREQKRHTKKGANADWCGVGRGGGTLTSHLWVKSKRRPAPKKKGAMCYQQLAAGTKTDKNPR